MVVAGGMDRVRTGGGGDTGKRVVREGSSL